VTCGVALVIFFAVLFRTRQYRVVSLATLVLIAAGAVTFYSCSHQTQRRVHKMVEDEGKDDVRVRFWLAKPTAQMWLDHFWFGLGPGHYDYRFPAYRPIQVQARPGHAHNDYLNTLADWGLLGTSLVAASWILLFAGDLRTWKSIRREPNELAAKLSNRVAFIFGASIALIAILVHSFFDFNMHIPANAILVVTLMALLSGHLCYATERYGVSIGWGGRFVITLIGLGAVLYLGQQGWRRAREYVCLEQAAKEMAYSPIMISALTKAAEIEPTNFETTYSIGEALRQLSWQGSNDYEKLALEAIRWFQEGIHLNPYDAYNYMKLGMCLDWVGKHNEATHYFEESVKCDPNNYYVLAHQGWHFIQTGDYAAAKPWFEWSARIKWRDNPIAFRYLDIIDRKLKETPAPAAR